jgi:hypothetical protein
MKSQVVGELVRFKYDIIIIWTSSVSGSLSKVAKASLFIQTGYKTQNIRRQISISCVGFEPTIQVFEWAKTVHDLDRAVIVVDPIINSAH